MDNIDEYRILPIDDPDRVNIAHDTIRRPNDPPNLMHSPHDPIWMNTLVYMFTKREYPAKYLTFLGNRPGPANKMNSRQTLGWGVNYDWPVSFYLRWRGVEYETVEEGIFRYDPGF